MKVIKINGADVYRDGGSYGFWFDADDSNWYELFIKVRKLEGEKEATKDYDPPVIYLEGCNSGNIVKKLSWQEANEFILPLSYENERFRGLVEIIEANTS